MATNRQVSIPAKQGSTTSRTGTISINTRTIGDATITIERDETTTFDDETTAKKTRVVQRQRSQLNLTNETVVIDGVTYPYTLAEALVSKFADKWSDEDLVNPPVAPIRRPGRP